MQNEAQRSRRLNAPVTIHRFRLGAVVLLLVGVVAWPLVFGRVNAAFFCLGPLGPWWLAVYLLICGGIAWMPPTARLVDRWLNLLRTPSVMSRTLASVLVAVAASAYLYFTAVGEHRQLFPYVHDECSYLIQAHQFAAGHLWMPAHPLADFFDSFQLFVRPVYASAYFPGTALLFVPGVWLHVSPFISAIIISGIVAGLVFWISAELVDGVAAGLAVLLLLSDGVYRQFATLTMGQMPLLLYSLLAVVAWLRWRATNRSIWLLMIGFFLGLAGVTRPVDALCFAIPILVAVLLRNVRRTWILLIGAFPLICLQLVLNHGITGHWLQTPFGLYADRDYPGTNYGFHPYDPAAKPQSDLPQKQALYREYGPTLREHQPANILRDLFRPHGPFNGPRLSWTLSQSSPVPFPMLLLLLPLSLLGLSAARGVVLVGLPLFVILYIPYVFFFPHYPLCAAPALILGILLGAKVLGSAWPSRRRLLEVGLTLFIAGTAIAALPQWDPRSEDLFNADLLASVNRQLTALPHLPAVVLFTYDPNRNTHEEPVYNADVAWPDDAQIIRAHDRGEQDRAILSYYAERQPARFFYRFDERTRTIQPLGRAADLINLKTAFAGSPASTSR